MKRNPKHTSKQLYQYLEQTGALCGSDAQIKAAKREYRKLYQTEWRKRNRAEHQEITIVLNQRELHIINQAAKKHRLSRPKFTKFAAIAYTNQSFVVPDILAINTMQEYLIMTYSSVQKMFDGNKLQYEIGKEVMERISALESFVMNALRQPERIEDRVAKEIWNNPALVESLRTLLKNTEP